MKKIVVIGEGHFGTAIATVLAHNGYEVTLWCYEAEIANMINQGHSNSKYFPDIKLNKNIKATNNLLDAIKDSEYIFVAIPVKFLRLVIEKLKPDIKSTQVIVCLSKGIEQDTLLFPTQIVQEILPNTQIAVISGPSFAKELVEQKLTGVNLATQVEGHYSNLQATLKNDYVKIKKTKDLLGLEICGALKNVLTIGIGIAQGAHFADNTIAYLFTKCLAEMGLLLHALGGQKETAYDLAGVGDLVLCAFGKSSRNLWFGQEIGKGKKLDDILKNNVTVEGLNTLQSVKQLSTKLNINLPFCNAVYNIVFEDGNIDSILKGL
ncbi:MAG: NAD(P)-dependent glycerol-3-phosphate dehydrogenase [Candidatus Babeliales bacterium]|nr:NAD(P)-dependent glycerol-3-phosphate dehydrogenase [Candidatus Babeliales bacterium]